MMKIKAIILMSVLTLIFTAGCAKAEKKQLAVYSFSGQNEQLAVSNGVIVINGTEEIFSGGDLKVTGDLFADIASYSTTFYTMSGNEKDVILSNSVTDMTGGTVNAPGDLGQISGDTSIPKIKIDDTSDLKNDLYFELTTIDKAREEKVYQLQLSLTEITKNAGD